MSSSPTAADRAPLPERLCHVERLVAGMARRQIDALVLSCDLDLFYLTGFNPIAHKGDEPRPFAAIFSRHDPDHPVLVVADYYFSHFARAPTWVADVRPFRAVMLAFDVPSGPAALDRFVTRDAAGLDYAAHGRRRYGEGLVPVCREALGELTRPGQRVGFDDLRLAAFIGMDDREVVDALDTVMYARAVKTPAELKLLRAAAGINQRAIEATVNAWTPGMSWRELNRTYHLAAVEQGGFVHDPGAMVLAHPRGADAAVSLQTGREDFAVEAGQVIMFDCHGTWNRYCWDGGKSWVVGGEPDRETARRAGATADAMHEIESLLRPGTRVAQLQAKGREVYRRHGLPLADDALIFFHGLGLSHMDLEQFTADGTPNVNWELEAGMVIASHLLYPGGERERMWLEDVALVTESGGEPLFTWGFEPLAGPTG